MRIHLPPLDGPYTSLGADVFARLAAHSTAHTLCDADEEPDLVLFTQAHQYPEDWRLKAIRDHPLRVRYPQRCFIYDERDLPWCSMPGLYVSMPHRAMTGFQRSVPYAWCGEADLVPLREREPDLLFSFVGGLTHPVRRRLFELRHDRAVLDRVDGYQLDRSKAESQADRRRSFLDTIARAKFVLCPRGHGAASIRAFEVMAAGRVPVVISDDWSAPVGPDWPACSLRVAEADVARIPELLEREEANAPARMVAARQAYDAYFAEPRRFDYLVSQLTELIDVVKSFPARGVRDAQYLRCFARDRRRALRAMARRG